MINKGLKYMKRLAITFFVGWALGVLLAQKATPITVPTGTVISVDLTTFLSTKTAQPGDNFYAEVTSPVVFDNTIAVPKGTTVTGRVVSSKRAGRIHGKSEMVLAFDKIIFTDGYTTDINVELKGAHGQHFDRMKRGEEKIPGEGRKGKDAVTVASTSATGAGIGAIAGRGTGTAIGAGAGAIGGLAAVFLGRGPDLILDKGTQLDLVVKKPITIGR